MKKHFLAILALCISVGAATQTHAQSGLRYEFSVKTTSSDSSDVTDGSGKIAVQGDKARFSMSQEDDDNEAKMEIISLDGGTRFLMLMPSKKKYIESKTQNVLGGLGKMIEAKNVKYDVKKIGAGPKILGHNTVHYKLKQSMTMVVNSPLGASENKEESEVDLYVTNDVKIPKNPWAGLNMLGAQKAILGDEYAAEIKKAEAVMGEDGVVLRALSKSKSTDSDGEVTNTTSNFEVTKIESVDIPASEFTVPAGYTKLEMPNLDNVNSEINKALSGLKGSAGSEAKSVKDAAKDGAKEGVDETKNEAKEAVKKESKEKAKKAIKGLFGK